MYGRGPGLFYERSTGLKPLPPKYKGVPTRVGTHTTHNPPSQPNSQSLYIRCSPGKLSVMFRVDPARQAIESIRQDEQVGGRGISNGYLSAEIRDRAQVRTRWPPSPCCTNPMPKSFCADNMRFRCLIHHSCGL